MQEIINKLGVMPNDVPRNSHSKQKTRKDNDDVASRTRSTTGPKKLMEIELVQSYKPSVTQVVKKSFSLCMMYVCLKVKKT